MPPPRDRDDRHDPRDERHRLPPRRADDPPEGWEPRRRRENEIPRAERVARRFSPFTPIISTLAAVFAMLAFVWAALGGQTILPNDRMRQVEENGQRVSLVIDSLRTAKQQIEILTTQVAALTAAVETLTEQNDALARIRCYESRRSVLSRAQLNCRRIIPDWDAVIEDLERERVGRGPAAFTLPVAPSAVWPWPLLTARFP